MLIQLRSGGRLAPARAMNKIPPEGRYGNNSERVAFSEGEASSFRSHAAPVSPYQKDEHLLAPSALRTQAGVAQEIA